MNIVEVSCGAEGCGYSPFPMERAYHDRCVRTHETWICPGGHRRHFVGETDEQKQHRKEVEQLKADNDWLETLVREARAEARRCPWPTCRDYVYANRSSLYEHMRLQHGMPLVAAVREAV